MTSHGLTGRTAVVTGAGSGIGAATARRLAADGAHVFAFDRDSDALERAVSGIPGIDRVAVDVTTDAALDAIAAAGTIDLLVNAAGILRRHDFLEHPLESFVETLDVNVRAPFRLARAVAAAHIERGTTGVIVNVCSIESFNGARGHAAYTASKTALLMLTRAMALELAGFGIRVAGVAPGVTSTSMNADIRSDREISSRLLSAIPAGRFGQPGEIAAVIAFLASDDASFVHGSVVLADGGMHVR